MPVPPRAGAQTEIHVLAAVAKHLVESAQVEKNLSPDHAARRRHRRPFQIILARRHGFVLGDVPGVTVVLKIDAGVVDQPTDGFPLHVAHARHVGQQTRQPGHRLQPAGQEHGVVVQQAEQRGAGEIRAEVVVRRESAPGVVQHHAETLVSRQGAQEFARAVRAAVVDENPLVVPAASVRRALSRQARVRSSRLKSGVTSEICTLGSDHIGKRLLDVHEQLVTADHGDQTRAVTQP